MRMKMRQRLDVKKICKDGGKKGCCCLDPLKHLRSIKDPLVLVPAHIEQQRSDATRLLLTRWTEGCFCLSAGWN